MAEGVPLDKSSKNDLVIPSVDPTQPSTTQEKKSTGFTTKDSTAAAEQEVASLLNAQAPALVAPSDLGNNNSTVIDSELGKIKLKMESITNDMLDSWVANLAKEAELVKEYLKSPQYLNKLENQSPAFFARQETQVKLTNGKDFQASVNSLSPTDQIERLQDWVKDHGLRVGLADGLTNYRNNVVSGVSSGDLLPFITASIVIVVGPAVELTIPVAVLSVDSTKDPQVIFANNTMAQFANMIPSDCRAELGLLGALFMGGAIIHAEGSTVKNVAPENPHNSKNFAANYAERVIQLAEGNVLDGFVLAMVVDKMKNSGNMSDSKKDALVSIFKTILLATALGALYKADTKWITGQEFGDLLTGKLKNFSTDPKQQELFQSLAGLINSELGKLDKLGEGNRMRAALSSYMDSNPTYDSFFDMKNAVDHIGTTTYRGEVSDVP